MREIRVAFDDFWKGFAPENNFMIKTLRKRYQVEIIDTMSMKPEDLGDICLDYLFFSCFGDRHVFYHCVKIFYTGECACPNFNECDYAMGFDHISFGDRYFRYPLYTTYYKKDSALMMNKNNTIDMEKKKFCSMVVSNVENANPFRERFFVELSKYKQVDSGGRALNNMGMPNGVKDKLEFQRQYKFSLAFENVASPGYCTEKLVQAYAAGTIPIYWGDPLVCKTFNPKSFVAVDEDNIEAAIRTIIELDNDDEKYMEMRKAPAIVSKEEEPSRYDLKFEAWLYHIMDQEKDTAYRIGKYGWNSYYMQERRRNEDSLDRHQYFERLSNSTLGRIKGAIYIMRGTNKK